MSNYRQQTASSLTNITNCPTCGFTPITNNNIRSAVYNWINDNYGAMAQYGDISNWDVSNVTIMRNVFANENDDFNQDYNADISNWDVSNVTDMYSMFKGASEFNQDISGWDTSSVTDMFRMFSGTSVFNQDISNWNTSGVTNMNQMFFESLVFNQDINTKSVTVGGVTYNAWDVSNVTDMGSMLRTAQAFDQDIGAWDVSNVTDMQNMFVTTYRVGDLSAKSVTVGGVTYNAWDVSSVTNMSRMFQGRGQWDGSLSGLGTWDTSGATDMSYMFDSSGFEQDLSSWCVSQFSTAPFRFNAFTPMTSAQLPNWGQACP
tara:strand:- start:265 stop:1215 length:951 start_codon:yes stop_codon:yes gene_type:complete